MNNTEKKLDALIEYLGLETEESVEFDENGYRYCMKLWEENERGASLITRPHPVIDDFKTTTYKIKPKQKDTGEIKKDSIMADVKKIVDLNAERVATGGGLRRDEIMMCIHNIIQKHESQA